VTEAYDDLMASSRVSTPTRQALAEQSRPDDADYVPEVLDAASLATLRAVLGRVIPQSPSQSPSPPIDLAARIDRRLARGAGDGWRFAALPADPVAYRCGLHTLDRDATRRFGVPFAQVPAPGQDELLANAAAGAGGDQNSSPDAGAPSELNGAQLRAWFEEVRADAVRLYIAHPRTLARIGYSGIANGGDGLPKSGFVHVGLNEREAWEPLTSPDEFP
jgi:hypothetical protein